MSSAINFGQVGNLGGYQGTDTTSYALTIGAVTTPPTKGVIVIDEARWWRTGDRMFISYNYQQSSGGSAGTGTYLFPLPAGYLIDTAKLTPTTTVEGSVVGAASVYNTVEGYVKAYDTGNLAIVHNGAGVGASTFASSSSASVGSTAKYSFLACVPIVGWSSSGAGGATVPRSEVTVDTGNGNGSTNNKVFRFVNTRKNVGTGITYADSATLGGSFTINETGVYAVSLTAVCASAMNFAIVVNGTAPTTASTGLTYATGLRASGFGGATDQTTISWTGNLTAADVVWAQGDGGNPTANSQTMITVTKVSN